MLPPKLRDKNGNSPIPEGQNFHKTFCQPNDKNSPFAPNSSTNQNSRLRFNSIRSSFNRAYASWDFIIGGKFKGKEKQSVTKVSIQRSKEILISTFAEIGSIHRNSSKDPTIALDHIRDHPADVLSLGPPFRRPESESKNVERIVFRFKNRSSFHINLIPIKHNVFLPRHSILRIIYYDSMRDSFQYVFELTRYEYNKKFSKGFKADFPVTTIDRISRYLWPLIKELKSQKGRPSRPLFDFNQDSSKLNEALENAYDAGFLVVSSIQRSKLRTACLSLNISYDNPSLFLPDIFEEH